MVGIFIVMGIIVLAVVILTRVMKSNNRDEITAEDT
jgi:hypothetical protein